MALSCLHRVILLPIIVGIKEFLKPLDKLKVVLKLPLHQFVYWNDLEVKEKDISPGLGLADTIRPLTLNQAGQLNRKLKHTSLDKPQLSPVYFHINSEST